MPTFDSVADSLYGLDPGGFIAARTEYAAQARESGDRELTAAIGRLRKPTVAAWLVNLLARERADELGVLLELGDACVPRSEPCPARTCAHCRPNDGK